jgi:ectoine hydroxylase-related dioxygenase (phytanoyl-CoA dioxygenase family)
VSAGPNLPSRPKRALAAREAADYARDGVVCLRGMFDLTWIEFLRNAVDAAMAVPGADAEEYTGRGGAGRFFGDLDLWKRLPAFRHYVMRSPCAEIAGSIMGSEKINIFYDQLLVKEPSTKERTPWHQDQPYWAVEGRQVCSIWLPLDVVPRETCVEFVKGSHNWTAHCPHHFADGTPYRDTGLPELPDIDANRSAYDIASWALEPGDCLVFQAMIVHGAAGNASSIRRRRALSTRWTGDDARYVRRRGEVAIPRTDPGLATGAPMDSAAFPVIWRRQGGLARSTVS